MEIIKPALYLTNHTLRYKGVTIKPFVKTLVVCVLSNILNRGHFA
jgi:hypothetical protein